MLKGNDNDGKKVRKRAHNGRVKPRKRWKERDASTGTGTTVRARKMKIHNVQFISKSRG